MAMAKNSQVGDEVRERIRAWLRHYASERAHQYGSQKAFAESIGLSGPGVNQILNFRRTPGFDVAIKMHRGLHVSLDTLIDTDPPKERSGERTQNPSQASLDQAAPGRRRGGGGA